MVNNIAISQKQKLWGVSNNFEKCKDTQTKKFESDSSKALGRLSLLSAGAFPSAWNSVPSITQVSGVHLLWKDFLDHSVYNGCPPRPPLLSALFFSAEHLTNRQVIV